MEHTEKNKTTNRRLQENGKRNNKTTNHRKKGKRNKKRQQKQLEYATERKTLISVENGLRTLNIASLNPDSMKETEMHHGIVKGLTKNKIQLSAIQETRITRDSSYMMDNYRIITASSGKMKKLESSLVEQESWYAKDCSNTLRKLRDKAADPYE